MRADAQHPDISSRPKEISGVPIRRPRNLRQSTHQCAQPNDRAYMKTPPMTVHSIQRLMIVSKWNYGRDNNFTTPTHALSQSMGPILPVFPEIAVICFG